MQDQTVASSRNCTARHAPRVLMLAAGLALGLTGCSSTSKTPGPAATGGAVNTGLEALSASNDPGLSIANAPDPRATPRTKGDLAAQAAMDLQELIDSGALDRSKTTTPPPAAASAPSEAAPVSTGLTAIAPSDTEVAAARAADGAAPALVTPPPVTATPAAQPSAEVAPSPAPTPAEPVKVASPSPAPTDPLVSLASSIAQVLRQPVNPARPISAALVLSPLEAARPGVLSTLEDPKSEFSKALSPADRATLLKAKDDAAGSGGTAEAELRRVTSVLAPPAPLKIAKTVLCTKVLGFGRYEPYPTLTFVAGQPIRAIVYTQLEGFASRPAREGDPLLPGVPMDAQLAVDLTQSLTLFQAAGGLQAWHRPARPVIDTARSKRSDFYLVQQIELPPTLSIGAYNLKVTVKDRTSGSEAEAVMTIQVVSESGRR